MGPRHPGSPLTLTQNRRRHATKRAVRWRQTMLCLNAESPNLSSRLGLVRVSVPLELPIAVAEMSHGRRATG